MFGALLAVAILVAAGMVALRLTDNEDGADGAWNTVVSLDQRSGEIVLLDGDGEEIEQDATFSVGSIDGVGAARGTFVLARTGDGWAALDITSGDDTPLGDPAGEGSGNIDVRWAHESEPVAVVSDTRFANAFLTNAVTGEQIDVGAEAGLERPLINGAIVFSTADAEVFGLTEVGSDPLATTLLVGFDREAVTLQGSLIGLDDDGAAVLEQSTSLNRLVFHDLDGERQSEVDVPQLVHASLSREGAITMVEEDGTLVRATRGSEELEELAEVDIGDGELELAVRFGDRLVLTTDEDEIVVVDDDGQELFHQRGALDVRSFGEFLGNARLPSGCVIVRAVDDT
ncbi:MAG: hypothetical protein M3337_07660, partial [Actinomycetota bacterium]|nr:hypothetical protein [Actinomycetota bacterium]